MKHFVTILTILLFSAATAEAQTYLDHLKQKNQGQGTVTVNQSKEIDELVNGSTPKTDKVEQDEKKPKKAVSESHPVTKEKHVEPAETHHEVVKKQEEDTTKKEETTKHETPVPPKTEKTEEDNDNTMEIPTVDMRKKVMRKAYKVVGYRVQAYAGGNSRADRQKAESIRTAIKMKFPNQPIYVHFYSPRWICRVGNYRSYDEAHWMLKQLQNMGYSSATIVKGEITVQY
ncbi:MAG: SPOR domain-containing protein [Prevotella sp.]|jgi:hypothetical protein|nr:SPOR domain-containing protein [Prevotella sp.]